MMILFELGLLIDINICFILPYDQKIAIKGGSIDQNLNTKVMELSDCLKILLLKIQRQHIFGICETN